MSKLQELAAARAERARAARGDDEAPAYDAAEELWVSSKSEGSAVALRRVVYRGVPHLDLRVFALRRDGLVVPTKKGVMLTCEQAREVAQKILEALGDAP